MPYDAPARDGADVPAGLWPGGAGYTVLSEAALDHSRRADIGPEQQVATLMDTFYRVVGSGFA